MTVEPPTSEIPGRDGRLLEVEDLVVRYGTAQVLHGVTIHVAPGEIVGVLGSNGAGKTTLLHAVSGLLRPVSGRVLLDGRDITGNRPAEILRAGISQVAEGRRIFRTQSVAANLELGAYARTEPRAEIESDLERVLTLFPVLADKARLDAALLSGGEQQMLAIGQAVMSRPKLLMMDEPSLGLAPVIIEHLVESLRELRAGGTTILLVEQQLALVRTLCDRLYSIRNGRVLIDGVAPSDLKAEEIHASYV